MIARIIEAKPEELRVFLEEAAGVSKYKERRRETENRLHDTRENLTRVEDIVRELSANLEKLEAQAIVATKYKTLAGRRRGKAAAAVAVAQERGGQRVGAPAARNQRRADRTRSANRQAARSRSATGNAARGALQRKRRHAGRAGRAVRSELGSGQARGGDPVYRGIAQSGAGADRRVERSARAVADAGRESPRRDHGRRRGAGYRRGKGGDRAGNGGRETRRTARARSAFSRCPGRVERRARRYRADRTGVETRGRASAQCRSAIAAVAAASRTPEKRSGRPGRARRSAARRVAHATRRARRNSR